MIVAFDGQRCKVGQLIGKSIILRNLKNDIDQIDEYQRKWYKTDENRENWLLKHERKSVDIDGNRLSSLS